MFGYVRAFKPHMRVCEYDTYKAVYCGICKRMGREFGQLSRATLSYDFTFLALVNAAVNDYPTEYEQQRCVAHPLKKTPCLKNGKMLDYPVAAAMILVYNKLKDDANDMDNHHKIISNAALAAFKNAYLKAQRKLPRLAEKIEQLMALQLKTEKLASPSLDLACEPSALMMAEIASAVSADPEISKHLERFGYFLGRFIYICDALDDLRKDCKNSSYNPFAVKLDLVGKQQLSQAEFKKAADMALDSVNLTMAALADSYVMIPQKKFRTINDNIVYLGMKNTFSLVYREKFNKNNKQ